MNRHKKDMAMALAMTLAIVVCLGGPFQMLSGNSNVAPVCAAAITHVIFLALFIWSMGLMVQSPSAIVLPISVGFLSISGLSEAFSNRGSNSSMIGYSLGTLLFLTFFYSLRGERILRVLEEKHFEKEVVPQKEAETVNE